MFRKILLASIISLGCTLTLDTSFAASGNVAVSAIVNCNGTQVVRTQAGNLQVIHGEPNLPGCIGVRTDGVSAATSLPVQTGAIAPLQVPSNSVTIVTNCNGTRLTQSGTEILYITRVEKNILGCVSNTPSDNIDTSTGEVSVTPKYNTENGPAFDIRSTDIANYRTYQMAQEGIRYVNPVRSVKMRSGKNMLARVNAYLIKNDAVLTDGSDTGWVKSQWIDVSVTDTRSNHIVVSGEARANGYIASRYLRNPNTSDLVRIGQADQAYWSDIAHVNVSHLVNVRQHPWFGSKILFVLSNQTNLYILSTVDNWSEVISDDRTIHGFIRSDFLVIDQAQRVDR